MPSLVLDGHEVIGAPDRGHGVIQVHGRRHGRREAPRRRRSRATPVHLIHAVSEVGHEACTEMDVHSFQGAQAPAHLRGTLGEAGLESIDRMALAVAVTRDEKSVLRLEFPEVLHSQLEDVSLLQLLSVLSLGLRLKGSDHEIFELIQATVDASSSLSLKQGFHHLQLQNTSH